MDESNDDDHRKPPAASTTITAAAETRRLARARLRSKIAELIRAINKPLHVIIAEHALPHLPPQSLHRLRSVSSSWNRRIISPIFTHTQVYTHRSLSGIFTNSAGPTPTFSPFDPKSDSIPDPILSFLPFSQITIKSSSNGLICCLGGLNYLICNPSTAQWTPLPKPQINHGPDPNLVLVFEPSVYNFASDYSLVCAFEIGPGSGVYGFDVFSSESGAWRASSEICPAEEIVASSGVAAGGAACWRTTMQTVVVYDPAADRARAVAWPMGYEEHARWELVVIAGKLCCVAVACGLVSVFGLGDGDGWGLLGHYLSAAAPAGLWGHDSDWVWKWVDKGGAQGGEVCRGTLRPLRFQSGTLDAVVAVDGKVYVLDLARRRVSYVLSGIETEGYEGDTVAYISTLAPVYPQASKEFSSLWSHFRSNSSLQGRFHLASFNALSHLGALPFWRF